MNQAPFSAADPPGLNEIRVIFDFDENGCTVRLCPEKTGFPGKKFTGSLSLSKYWDVAGSLCRREDSNSHQPNVVAVWFTVTTQFSV